MNYCFYSNNQLMINALGRYYNTFLHSTFSNIGSDRYIFWDEMKAITNETLLSAESYQDYNIIPLVYSEGYPKCCINLLNLSNLQAQVKRAIKNYDKECLLSIASVQEQLKAFFKGHGQDSLQSVLNWTRYYMVNGLKLAEERDKETCELFQIYIKPGRDYWQGFCDRFEKYFDFLLLCGFNRNTNSIKNFIIKLDEIIKDIDIKNFKTKKSEFVAALIDDIEKDMQQIEEIVKTNEI